MNTFQKTISKEVMLQGIGIHKGKECTLTLKPAEINNGITFYRTDLDNKQVKCTPKNLIPGKRATILQENGTTIFTPEHLLAACSMCSISNLNIYLDTEEIPILDGSASPFIEALQEAIPVSQNEPLEPIIIKEPVIVKDRTTHILVLPSDTPRFSYYLKSPEKFIPNLGVNLLSNKSEWISSIGPARTWGLYKDVKALLDQGLAQGGSLDNAVVIDETKYLNELRFEDEIARHKVLDIIGDTWILGSPIQGHVIGFGSGHALNSELVLKLS
jgi:UDP-3-O-[3-hydroxymyristoyl] N-acetylglucosamine deacetylase